MKRFFYLAVIAILCLTLSSCSKNNPATFSRQILGTWSLFDQGDGRQVQYPTSYTFRNDGTGTMSSVEYDGQPYSFEFQYSIKNGTLFMGAMSYRLSFEGNKMFWEMGPFTIVLIKQP